MWWLWIAGPLAAVVVYVLTGSRDKRRDAEVERWRGMMGARDGKPKRAKEGPRPKRVNSMPGPLMRALVSTGGGEPIGYFELVPKIAYLAVLGADALQGSDHVTVVAKLDDAGPTFSARPLPIIEGERALNTGVQFKKDEDFMALFLVDRSIEGGPLVPATEALDKSVRKWLSPPLRAALLDLPEGWLRVDGKAKTMAFTLYGTTEAERILDLITAADVVFAEYGADGGPSLFGDEDEDDGAPVPAPKSSKPKVKKSAEKTGEKAASSKDAS